MLLPPKLHISVLSAELAVWRLPPDVPVPATAGRDPLWSVTCTPEETSIICRADVVPAGAQSQPGWRAFKVEGPLDFSIVGLLDSLLTPLVEAKVTVFAISTYDTDYVLVRDADLHVAATALRVAGHHVAGVDHV